MRRRLFLINIGAKTLSPKGMALVPWRRGKRYSVKAEGTSPNPHTARGDHGGNVPAGKVTKGKRFKTGLPGTPNGVCTKIERACRCGKHFLVNR